MKHIHFYGKYMADMRTIFHIVRDMGEYEVSSDLQGLGRQGSASGADYVVTSHSKPDNLPGKNIHVRHGHGVFPWIPKGFTDKKVFLKDYRKFHTIRVFGDMDKSVYMEYGFTEDRLMMMGMPFSIDLLAGVSPEQRAEFLLQRNLNPGKKTVLYSPTWGHNKERGFFVEWFQDGREAERVEKFCRYVREEMGCNLIVRFHEKRRYSEDWRKKYQDSFSRHGVHFEYLDDEPNNFQCLVCSDVLLGDLSSTHIYYYILDKPVVHIGLRPFRWKVDGGYGGIGYSRRAGYVVTEFNAMLDALSLSLKRPDEFSWMRKSVVADTVKYIGEESREAVEREIRRVCV
jgi:hypothetical protein